MAGMLVADGAFGLIGWDTKTERSHSCLDQTVFYLYSLHKLVLFIYSNFCIKIHTVHYYSRFLHMYSKCPNLPLNITTAETLVISANIELTEPG